MGAGPYWPSSPLVSGPREKPAVMANAARRPPAPSPEARDSSPTQALPTLKTTPLTTPCRKRAAKSSVSESPAAAKASDASADSTMPGMRDPAAAEPVGQRAGEQQGGHEAGGVAAEQRGEHLGREAEPLLVDEQQRGRDVRAGRDGEQGEHRPLPDHRRTLRTRRRPTIRSATARRPSFRRARPAASTKIRVRRGADGGRPDEPREGGLRLLRAARRHAELRVLHRRHRQPRRCTTSTSCSPRSWST